MKKFIPVPSPPLAKGCTTHPLLLIFLALFFPQQKQDLHWRGVGEPQNADMANYIVENHSITLMGKNFLYSPISHTVTKPGNSMKF